MAKTDNKARFFFNDDLPEYFSDRGSGTGKKKKKKALVIFRAFFFIFRAFFFHFQSFFIFFFFLISP